MAEGETNRIYLSQSQVRMFRSCRQKWHFRYQEHLTPKGKARPLRLGTLFHAAMEAAYKSAQTTSLDPVGAARSALMATIRSLAFDEDDDELVIQATEMSGRYLNKYFLDDLARYDIIGVEQRFDVPLMGDKGQASKTRLTGYVDLILLDRKSQMLIPFEFKSSAMAVDMHDTKFDVDTQLPAYLYALRYLQGKGKLPGNQVGHVLLTAIRTKGPSQPKILKNGGVSAAGCDTTRQIYWNALRKHHTPPSEPMSDKQTERLEGLPKNEDRWLKRHEWFYSPEEIDRANSELLTTGQEVRDAKAGRLAIVRNSEMCMPGWAPPCAYRDVCVNDTIETRASMYDVKSHR